MIILVPWVGGKAWLIPTLREIVPRSYNCFVDVFGGGGSVTLNLPMRQSTQRIYNDIDKELTNFMKVVQKQLVELLVELRFLPYISRDEFDVLCDFLNKTPITNEYMEKELKLVPRIFDPPDAEVVSKLLKQYYATGPVQRAAAFYKVRRYSFNGMGESFAPKSMDIRQFFNQLQEGSERLQGVGIENKNFVELIPLYDGDGTLFFMDPPYYEAEGMYSNIFSLEDHLMLNQFFKRISGFGIMTYNDCEFIRDLYKDFYIMHIDRPDSLSKKAGKRYEELIITNYDPREAAAQMSLFAQIPERCTLINIPEKQTYIKQWR